MTIRLPLQARVLWISAAIVLAPLVRVVRAEEYPKPFQASLTALPATAIVGQEVELRLTLKVNEPWHVFADASGSGGQPQLKLTTRLPAGVETLGQWQRPKHESLFEGYEIHVYNAGEHVFRQRVKVTAAAGLVTLATHVTYQACNPEFCGPVQVAQLSAQLQVGVRRMD